MRAPIALVGAAVLACLAMAGPATAAPAKPMVREGQPQREVLGGRWLFRPDDLNVGIEDDFMDQRSTRGWGAISVPFDFNARERLTNKSSVGWYRRDITMREDGAGVHRIVRFEGCGHFCTVWINGRQVTKHAGSYLPFEADLGPLKKGVNRLVVRVSSMRARTDLSHWRPASFNGYGNGGWWNFGGIHREVTIRDADGVDIDNVQALPRMRCGTCATNVGVTVKASLTNVSDTKQRVKLTLRAAGQTIRVTPRFLNAGQRREITTRFTMPTARLWDIRRPNLYGLKLTAEVPGELQPVPDTEIRRAKKAKKPPPEPERGEPREAVYTTSYGVRDIHKTADGRVLLNGHSIRLLGVSTHEDDPLLGAAWRAPQIRTLVNRIDDLQATVLRAHYPLNQAVVEAMDRRGVLVWDEAPIYQVQNDRWELPSVRANAVKLVEEVVRRDRGHASVLAFSMANELPDPVTPNQASFIRGAAAAIRKLDPTRLVAIDRVSRIGAESDADPVWKSVDALGVNEYFGWYRGAFPPIPEATSRDLGPYLDTLHQQQPHAALFATEFGAEANRDGYETDKGTYSFQVKFLRDHLAIGATRPFLGGQMIWALKDFRVIPGWAGGNPLPDPPYNHKGLLDIAGRPKPAYYEVRQIYQAATRAAGIPAR